MVSKWPAFNHFQLEQMKPYIYYMTFCSINETITLKDKIIASTPHVIYYLMKHKKNSHKFHKYVVVYHWHAWKNILIGKYWYFGVQFTRLW